MAFFLEKLSSADSSQCNSLANRVSTSQKTVKIGPNYGCGGILPGKEKNKLQSVWGKEKKKELLQINK